VDRHLEAASAYHGQDEFLSGHAELVLLWRGGAAPKPHGSETVRSFTHRLGVVEKRRTESDPSGAVRRRATIASPSVYAIDLGHHVLGV